MPIETFRIEVPDGVLADLRRRLEATRFVEPIGDGPWRAGVGGAELRALVASWLEFDWRAEERRLNAVDHHIADVGGHRLHFVRVGPSPAATRSIPLLLLHGWPSAFVEYVTLARLLSEGTTTDAGETIAFDVIVPSLPGFVFSELPDPPLTRQAIAADLHSLMTDVLGYDRYGAFGGDIGGGAAQWLGALHPEHVLGVQLIHGPTPGAPDPVDDAERAYLAALDAYDADDGGYSEIMLTRPDTIAAALADSPAGLLAWIADKWHSWVDGDADDPDVRSAILTIATLYWATGSIGTSFRQYHDWYANPPRPPIRSPLGVLLSREPSMADFPRSLAERAATDLRSFERAPRGGHFLALEQPDLAADRIRRFFSELV